MNAGLDYSFKLIFPYWSKASVKRTKAKRKEEKLNLEAYFWQTIKRYKIYDIIVSINGNSNFLPWIPAGEERIASMRNQTN